ncbi:MAG: GAF domain-containing protein, partial [Anaerolineales bacterium]|nr:GAF domain-containing protein [Anaerolineales bacterium]
MVADKLRGDLYQAATKAFDIQNPTQALISLLQTTTELLGVERAALYEMDDSGSGFVPRFSHGIAMSELGHVPSKSEHKILRKVFSKNQAASTNGETGSLGLPLAPGHIACAPCRIGDHTIGLLFAGRDEGGVFDDTALATLEILAARAAEIFTHARQTASQGYLFHKLSLLYQATHAITGTRDRAEAIKQTAAHLLKATSADECEISVFDDGNGETQRFRQQLGKTMQQKVVPISSDKMPDYPIHKKVLEELRPESSSLTPPVGSAKDIAMLEAENLSASVVFALAAGKEPIGLVRLLFSHTGHKINEQETELAQAIINIGTVGLQDAIHFETAEARATQLQTLGEIGREMTSTLDLEAALQKAMGHTQHLLKAEAVVLFLLDESAEQLIIKASGGARLRIRDVAIRLEEGIAGWVTRNNSPLIVNDVRTNPLYHSAIDGQTGLLTTSVLCVPLERRGEVLGVIEAINHPRGTFTEADQNLLRSVASWAAVAIDNANLFQGEVDARSRLES